MNAQKRGQASMEYLMMMSLLLLIILPAITMFMQYANERKAEVEEAQIFTLGTKLMLSTQEVYYQGEGSRITLKGYCPERLVNITFHAYDDQPGGEYIVYLTSARGVLSDIGFPVSVPVALDALHTRWGAGMREIRLDTLRNTTSGELYVNVTIN